MLPCVCVIIDNRKRQNVARTSVTLLLSCSYFILTSSAIQLEPNLFVNLNLFLCYWLVKETPNTTHFHPLLWVTILSHFEAVDNEVEASFSNE